MGPAGPQGEPGFDGVDGAPGEMGPVGPAGPQGIQGVPGPAGVDGAPGIQGPPGERGLQGERGPVGPAGVDGIDGTDGAPGAPGADGADGVVDPSMLYIVADGTTIYDLATVSVSCNSGDIVLTGGCFFNSGSGLLDGNYPTASSGVSNDIPDSWTCRGRADSARLNAHVVCIDLP